MIDLPYTIRKAGLADTESVTELLLALQDHMEDANPDLWRMTDDARCRLRSQVAARAQAPQSRLLAAEHRDDGIIGLISGRIVTNNRYTPRRAGIVDQIYVRPDYRRQGVGVRLVSELCRFFASQGVTDLSLRFIVGNQEADGFWLALGFAPRIVTVGARLDTIESYVDQALGR